MLINDLIKGNKKFREASFPKYECDLKQLVETGFSKLFITFY